MPARARPSDAPMMLASASGVSTTRSAPKRSTSPLVVRNTPPNLPTSNPSSITRGSLSISSPRALLIASTIVRCGTSAAPSVKQLSFLLHDALGRVLVDVGEDILRSRRRRREGHLQRHLILTCQLLRELCLALLIPEAQACQILLYALDRVPLSRLLVLLRVLVARWVVRGVVEAHAIGHRLDESGAFAFSRPLHGGDRDVVDGHHVIAIDLDAGEPVPGRSKRKARRRRLDAARCRDRPLVVLQEEHDRRFRDAGQVEGLVKVTLGRAAFADVRHHDRVLASEAQPPG